MADESDEIAPLGTLKITMFGKEFTVDPNEDLELTISDLGTALQTQTSKFAQYAVMRDMANNIVESLETRLQQYAADLDADIRNKGMLPSGAKISEDGMKQAIRADEEYQSIQDGIVNTKLKASILSSYTLAFEHRRDMIKVLASRVNNSAFNDSDVKATPPEQKVVISESSKKIGQHPSKKGSN